VLDHFSFTLQDALKQLWRLAYPDRELPSLKSELWKDMGWQGSDPSTDFRYVEDVWKLALDVIYGRIYSFKSILMQLFSMIFEGVEGLYHWRI
jgi:hypothetical protein